MSDVQNLSYSLLNQNEIDTLVNFLLEKKNSVGGDVMNQESIDKLIALISGDSNRIITDVFNPFVSVDPKILDASDLRKDINEECELRCSVNEANGYLLLTAYNTQTGYSLPITPNMICKNDITEWGYAVSPIFFNRIAKVFHFKYTRETHDQICNIYAKHTYGDENHKISELVLPDNQLLLSCLL